MKPENSLLANYLTRGQLAEALGRSTRTLDRWQVQKVGPPRLNIGKLIIYSRERVQHWLDQQEQTDNKNAR